MAVKPQEFRPEFTEWWDLFDPEQPRAFEPLEFDNEAEGKEYFSLEGYTDEWIAALRWVKVPMQGKDARDHANRMR